MVLCPNFGHPTLTSLFTKSKFLQVKNSFAIIFDFVIFLAASTKFVNLNNEVRAEPGVEVRAHYPSC